MMGATVAVDWGDFLVRLFVDLVAISLLAAFLYLRRHARRDLFLVYTAFNVGLFIVLAVITSRHISAGLGFGLFAILSIIRLRSEPFDNTELAYFFGALVIALVNGFERQQYAFIVVLNLLVVATLFFIDHPAFHTTIRRRRINVDRVETDSDALRTDLARRLGLEIVELSIDEIDYVRETTRVSVRYVADPRTTASPEPISEGE